jgi:hypothetical protein
MKAIPKASRKGTVAHVDEVEVSLRSMTATFRFGLFGTSPTINLFGMEA